MRTQTSCVRRYVIAYLFTKLSSKYDNPEAEYIPKSNANADLSEPKAAWNGLHDLRRSLTARGMFNEANLLFRVELNRSVPTQRAPVAEDFLTAIAELPTSRGKDYIDAAVRLQWVTTHLQLRNNSRAMEELKKSEASFNSWCIEFDIPDKDTVPHSAGICLEKLEFLSDYAQKLDWAEKFSHEMERIGSSKTGMCLSTAADSARALYESTNEEKYLAKFFDLHKRLEHFDENVSEDICDLVRHRNSLIAFTIERVVDRQKSLEWIDGFLERYPHFTSPGELESLHTRRALLLRSLRRLEEAQQAEEMATELNGKGPLIGKWLHLSFNKILAPSTSMNHSSQYDPEDDEEEFNFASFWAPIVGNQKKQANTVVQLLHDWLIEDVVSGHITVEKFRKMMDITKSEVTDSDLHGPKWRALITKMKNEKPGSIWSALFPADTDSETSQVIRRELIINWLSYPPQGQRNKRIFCLLMLRDSRQRYFSDKPLWDLLVIELEHLLELYSKLPGHIRETCRSYVSSWYSSLALAHEVQLGDAPDARDPNMYVVLLKAENIVNWLLQNLERLPTQQCWRSSNDLELRYVSGRSDDSSSS